MTSVLSFDVLMSKPRDNDDMLAAGIGAVWRMQMEDAGRAVPQHPANPEEAAIQRVRRMDPTRLYSTFRIASKYHVIMRNAMVNNEHPFEAHLAECEFELGDAEHGASGWTYEMVLK